VLHQARGYWGTKSRHKQQAKVALWRAGQFAYRDRRQRRRDFRRLWITRITAACRMRGTRYSRFMNGLQRAGVGLNRKMLSQLAIEDPRAFDQIAEIADQHATAPAGVR
jgi:large subunit ribosomal protein L20